MICSQSSTGSSGKFDKQEAIGDAVSEAVDLNRHLFSIAIRIVDGVLTRVKCAGNLEMSVSGGEQTAKDLSVDNRWDRCLYFFAARFVGSKIGRAHV